MKSVNHKSRNERKPEKEEQGLAPVTMMVPLEK
jgi:hypothetical protein